MRQWYGQFFENALFKHNSLTVTNWHDSNQPRICDSYLNQFELVIL